MEEIISCRGLAERRAEGADRRTADIAQDEDVDHQQHEEHAEHRPVAARPHRRLVEPGEEEQQQDRSEHRQHAPQFGVEHDVHGERAKDRVERPEIPFGNDMRGRRQRIGRNVIVRMPEIIGREERHHGVKQQEGGGEPAVLGRVERVEGQGVLLVLDVDPGRVARSRYVQRPDVEDDHAGDHERQQIMEREEARQRRLVGGVAAEQPYPDRLADQREGREEAGDDLRAPIAHLAPRQDVAHEACRHHQQIDDEAEHPHQLARRLVAAVVEPAENVDVGDQEEEAGAVHMRVAKQPAGVDVAHDELVDAVERTVGGRHVMHRKDDAGHDLDGQENPGENSEIPEIIEVARHRIAGAGRAVDEARKRQALVQPLHHRMLGFVGLGPGKAHWSASPLSRSRPSSAT